MNTQWHNVTRKEPCPVCGHGDWCSVSNNGEVCVCRRVPSSRPCKSGNGWIHALRSGGVEKWRSGEVEKWRGGGAVLQPSTSILQPPTSDLQPSFTSLHASFDGDEMMQDGLALSLGLFGDSFTALDVRFNHANECMSFPMRDAEGNVTGLRYRHLTSGKKWSAKGSKDGLFYDARPGAFAGGETTGQYFPDELVVLEGPSDTAAALCVGLPAVGRSSCLTGAAPLKGLAARLKVKRLTIVADNDAPHLRPDGTSWRPGLDGAKRLAESMRLPCRIVLPPPDVKDFRAWFCRGGLTMARFYSAASAARWRFHEGDWNLPPGE